MRISFFHYFSTEWTFYPTGVHGTVLVGYSSYFHNILFSDGH